MCIRDRVNTAGDLRYINHRFTETFGYTLADVPTIDDWWQSAYPLSLIHI